MTSRQVQRCFLPSPGNITRHHLIRGRTKLLTGLFGIKKQYMLQHPTWFLDPGNIAERPNLGPDSELYRNFLVEVRVAFEDCRIIMDPLAATMAPVKFDNDYYCGFGSYNQGEDDGDNVSLESYTDSQPAPPFIV